MAFGKRCNLKESQVLNITDAVVSAFSEFPVRAQWRRHCQAESALFCRRLQPVTGGAHSAMMPPAPPQSREPMENILTLLMLVFLQAVLGFDNLLYISIESKRVQADKQSMVRKLGIGLAIGLRIVLLFAIVKAIDLFQAPFAKVDLPPGIYADFNVHSIIVLVGGLFIIYTAFKEIAHMLALEDIATDVAGGSQRTVAGAIAWIVAMNLVFSFDSILSAIALTDVFWVMAAAIIVSGVMMIMLADRVAEFLQRNRMYEVLGLFILLIVGVMLLSEGAHLAHLKLFGHPVEPMTKTTFYFTIVTLVLVDIAQSRYRKKLNAARG